MKWICLSLALLTTLSAQTPSVALVANAATNLVPGLPNSGIAKGAMFVVYGSNLGPTALSAITAYPLKPELAGTSVRVTVGGATVDALPYYTSANQMAAILPSTTPAGAGTITVTYNGATSAPAPITVVSSNVGLYTVNSQGTGDAVVTFADYRYVTAANAAHPGDIVILWANGLGPIPGEDARPPVSADMADVPLEVYVGGRRADVLFHGRNSCCASLDQINIRIPEGAISCRTPIVLKIGNQVSNTVAIPTAASGSNCAPAFAPTQMAAFHDLLAKPQPLIANIALTRNQFITRNDDGSRGSLRSDTGSAFFFRVPRPQAGTLATLIDTPPLGACSVTANSGTSIAGLPAGTLVNLPAGQEITVNGPNGNRSLPLYSDAPNYSYFTALGSGVTGNYLDPGAYAVSGNGAGEIGPFRATLSAGQPLRWTNQESLFTVSREAGMEVTWTGGDPNGFVQIGGQVSATVGGNAVVARFDCFARTLDGRFTVPPAVLLSLPGPAQGGTISVTGFSTGASYLAPGIDYGRIVLGTQSANLGTVTYQ